jgi:hypothetical protein
MKVSFGQILLLIGCLLLSGGLLFSSAELELIDIFAILFMWCFFLSTFKFHNEIFKKQNIPMIVLPVLALGFLWLLLNINKLLLLWAGQINTYAVLLGWGVFNTGLYYDTRKALRVLG